MLKESITYFEKKGPSNTEDTLKLAVAAARELNIKNIVVATNTGDTARMLVDHIPHEGIMITVVTYAYGQKEPGQNPMSAETRRYLMDKGCNLCTAAHALSGVERSISTTFGGVYPVEMIAHTLRMFGQGTKVCVEISAMAADAGCVVSGEPVIAIGGSAKGADTAIVLRPEVSCRVLKTKIDRVICKPID